MNQREILGFNAKIIPVKPLNKEMTLCKCYVLALGKNRNLTYISKEVVEDALPTIYNIPVVGHVYVDEDGEYHMGGHDEELKRNEEGKLIFKSLCVPFGTVPCQDNIHFETIIDSFGNEVIYQVADIILWTGRYPDLYKAVYNDDIYFGQSMEINVKAYEPLDEDSKYTNIKKFDYSALCLLGKSDNPEYHVEPCFPESRVEPYHFSFDDSKFNDLMQEFKKELSECFQTIDTKKGGKEELTTEILDSTLNDVIVEEELTANSVKDIANKDEKHKEKVCGSISETDEHLEDNVITTEEETEEEIQSSIEEIKKETLEEKTVESKVSIPYLSRLEIIRNACSELHKCTEDGCVDYYVCDFDDKYAYLQEFKMEHDKVSNRYCRIEYVFADDSVAFIGELETVIPTYLTVEEIEKLTKLKAEYSELKQFHDKRLEADRIKEYDAIASEFSDLTNIEEFSKLVEDRMSFATSEEFKEKCFAIRGKAITVPTVEKPKNKILINIDDKLSSELYGGFFKQYPPRSGK